MTFLFSCGIINEICLLVAKRCRHLRKEKTMSEKKEASKKGLLNTNLFVKAVIIPLVFAIVVLGAGYVFTSHDFGVLPSGNRSEVANAADDAVEFAETEA